MGFWGLRVRGSAVCLVLCGFRVLGFGSFSVQGVGSFGFRGFRVQGLVFQV